MTAPEPIQPLTEEELATIRRRSIGATPGPWTRFGRSSSNPDGDDEFLGHEIEGPPEASRGQFARVADAEFIAHARSDVPRLLAEVDRLRAENTAQAARIAAVRELRRGWFQDADAKRSKADATRGLTEVERAELRQAAVEMEHCARQVGLELGPTPEEDPDFMLKDLGRRALDQSGEGQANG
jgi:hypothetical protein